jgi:hypothetical protein
MKPEFKHPYCQKKKRKKEKKRKRKKKWNNLSQNGLASLGKESIDVLNEFRSYALASGCMNRGKSEESRTK